MELLTALQKAKERKHNLESIYNEVTDAAVIDSIIHQLIVAEQNYNRLLQKARETDLTAEVPELR